MTASRSGLAAKRLAKMPAGGGLAIWGVPLALLAVLLVSQLVAVWLINGGHFVYSLDDAYIHLALARRISAGHYGINLWEASAPSSSILWPFLLAPLINLPVAHGAPLLINSLLAAATLALYAAIVFIALCPCQRAAERLFALLLTLLLIPATNLVGLVFTGMEHSLQLFLTSLVVTGLIVEARGGKAHWWLVAAIVAGPLVRYENLVISLPALLVLALRGQRRAAAIGAVLLAVTLSAYTLFLTSLGLGPLPSSVMAKSAVAWQSVGVPAVTGNAVENLRTLPGQLLVVALLLFAGVALRSARPRPERLLAGAMSLSIVGHLLLGTMDGYHRYEVYIYAAACLMLIYLFRDRLHRLALRQPAYQPLLVLLLFGALASREYATVLLTNPLAANNIYQQQYQMYRFSSEIYQRPVAVVDLGRVAYENEAYVLDLWGLASPAALAARKQQGDPAWMADLAMAHDVKLAMIYDFRFPRLPASWVPLGELRLGGRRMSVADDRVNFYATGEVWAAELRPLLVEFGQMLPPGVEFHFADPAAERPSPMSFDP